MFLFILIINLLQLLINYVISFRFGQTVTLPVSVSGEYFYGDQMATIPPYGTYMFEITYSPLATTVSPQIHRVITSLQTFNLCLFLAMLCNFVTYLIYF